MKQTDTFYTFIVGGGTASVAFLIGGIDHLITALVIIMAVDFISGMAASEEKLSSKRGYRGLLKKGAMIGLVVVAHQLDIVAGGESHFLRNAMIMFLIAVEGISILENMASLGVPVPKFLRERLEQIKGNTEEKGDDQ